MLSKRRVVQLLDASKTPLRETWATVDERGSTLERGVSYAGGQLAQRWLVTCQYVTDPHAVRHIVVDGFTLNVVEFTVVTGTSYGAVGGRCTFVLEGYL